MKDTTRGTTLRAVLLAGVLAVGSGCADTGDAGAPPPTIGLSTDFGDAAVGSLPVAVGSDLAAGAADVDSIVMIGDSITAGALAPLEQAFAEVGFDDVRINAAPGKRISRGNAANPSGVAVARTMQISDNDHDGELWVVALGTNDIGQYASADEVWLIVEEMLLAMPDDVPLVWVDTYWRDRPDDAAMVNAVVEERLAARGNAAIANWNALAPSDGVMTSDGVHPNPDGAKAFAALTVSTVLAFLGR